MGIPHGQGTANPLFRPSSLDGNQVLQYAFDEEQCRLRVDSSVTIGETEVIIDHTNDSIRIGDGTDLVTTSTIGPSVGLDVNVINNATAGTPGTSNVSAAIAGTGYQYSIPVGTKRLTIRSRERGRLRFAYSAGDLTSNFVTVPPGNTKTIDNIATTASITLHFSSTKNGDVLEIETWS